MGVRTTSNGAPGRFTADQPDGLNLPDYGAVAGRPPVIFITGGGTLASADPATISMDTVLDAFTDSATEYAVGEPNAPWSLGGPGSTGSPPGTPGTNHTSHLTLVVTPTAINNCAAWMRTNLGCSALPPILIGVSNGWVCSIIYARDNPVTGIIGLLPVVNGHDGLVSEDATIRGLGLRERIGDAWNTTGTTPPTDPRYSPYDDIANYPNLVGKLQLWYSCNDPLFVGGQMAFGARMRAEMHNVGDYGHLGTLFDGGLPVGHADPLAMVAFADGLW